MLRHVSIGLNEDLSIMFDASPQSKDDDLTTKLEKYRKENILLMELIDQEDRKIKEPQSALI